MQVCVAAARAAGRLLANATPDRMAVRTKSGACDLVTSYDVAAERLIVDRILAAYPSSSICTEEYRSIVGDGLCWYVDPIDGTNNFARGLPFSCVSIAVTSGGEPIAACVYDPWRDELFTSDAVAEAASAGPDNRIVLTDLPHPGEPVEPWHLAALARILGGYELRRIGSTALALAYVATGRAALAANFDVQLWDVAAGAMLVRSAGGGYAERRPATAPATSIGFIAHSAGAADLAADLDALLAPWIVPGRGLLTPDRGAA